MSLVLYHNPRCTKSRQALKLLEDRGLKPRIVLYLESPPAAAEIKRLMKLLGLSPRQLMRAKEPLYKELGLDNPGLSERDLIGAMAENPILIERPILVSGTHAVIGRPPERILEIVGD
ncbi:MAG TPA: arsenate reductase (glutaredoxin) [Hyphomicrobiaceae bacterium]|nr:arsenate reductase (glutaredoxin) [Hyphomicrobiaceae bacterium]